MKLKQGSKFVLIGSVVGLIFSLTVVILFRLFTGKHPECGVNPDVGPCGFWNWVFWSPYIYLQSAVVGGIVGLTVGYLKGKKK